MDQPQSHLKLFQWKIFRKSSTAAVITNFLITIDYLVARSKHIIITGFVGSIFDRISKCKQIANVPTYTS